MAPELRGPSAFEPPLHTRQRTSRRSLLSDHDRPWTLRSPSGPTPASTHSTLDPWTPTRNQKEARHPVFLNQEWGCFGHQCLKALPRTQTMVCEQSLRPARHSRSSFSYGIAGNVIRTVTQRWPFAWPALPLACRCVLRSRSSVTLKWSQMYISRHEISSRVRTLPDDTSLRSSSINSSSDS